MKRRVAALALLLSLSVAAAILLRDAKDIAPRPDRLRAAVEVPPWKIGAHPQSLPAGLIAAHVVQPPAPDRDEVVIPPIPPVDPASRPLDSFSSPFLPE